MKVSDLIKQLQEGNADDAEVEVMLYDRNGTISYYAVEGVASHDLKYRGSAPTPEIEYKAAIMAGNVPPEFRTKK